MRRRPNREITYRLFLLVLSCFITNFLLILSIINLSNSKIPGKTLFVISEPSDEVIFFGPSVLRSHNPYILSISRPLENRTMREDIFLKSCKMLKSRNRCFIEDTLDQKKDWMSAIQEIVLNYSSIIKPDRIITYSKNSAVFGYNRVLISLALAPDVYSLEDHSISQLSSISISTRNRTSHQPCFKETNTSKILSKTPKYFLRAYSLSNTPPGLFGIFINMLASRISSELFVIIPIENIIYQTLKKAILLHKDYLSSFIRPNSQGFQLYNHITQELTVDVGEYDPEYLRVFY